MSEHRSSWPTGSSVAILALATVLELQDFLHPGWWGHKLFLDWTSPGGIFLLAVQTDFSLALG